MSNRITHESKQKMSTLVMQYKTVFGFKLITVSNILEFVLLNLLNKMNWRMNFYMIDRIPDVIR